MNKLVAKLAGKLGIKWLTGQVRAAAEGKLGQRWHDLYWALASRKRGIGLVFTLESALLARYGDAQGVMLSGAVATFFIAVGLLDSNFRTDTPEWIHSTAWWRWLADNSAMLATLMGATVGAAAQCSPDTMAVVHSLHLTCAQVITACGALGIMASSVGLSDIALKAQPPTDSRVVPGPQSVPAGTVATVSLTNPGRTLEDRIDYVLDSITWVHDKYRFDKLSLAPADYAALDPKRSGVPAANPVETPDGTMFVYYGQELAVELDDKVPEGWVRISGKWGSNA